MQNSKNTLKSPRWCQSRLVESGFECGAAFLHSLGQSLQGRPSGKAGHVRYATESGSRFRALAVSLSAIAA